MFKNLVNRLRNQAFTTSSDYDIKLTVGGSASYTDAKEKVVIADAEVFVGAGLSEKEAEALVLYSSAHEGAHIKYSDTEPLRALAGVIKEKGYNPKMLVGIIQVAEDLRIDTRATEVLPGYADLRKTTMTSATKLFSDKPSDSLEANYVKELSFRTHGGSLRENAQWQGHSGVDFNLSEKIYETIKDIVSQNMGSSGELIDAMVDYYDKELSEIFDTPPEDENGTGDSENQEGDNNEQGENNNEQGNSEQGENNNEQGNSGGEPKNDIDDAMDDLEKSFKGEDTYKDLIGDEASEQHQSKISHITRESEEAHEELKERKAKTARIVCDDYIELLSAQEKAEKVKAINTDMHIGMEPVYGKLKPSLMAYRKQNNIRAVSPHDLELYRGTGRELGNKIKQLLKAETSFRGDLERTGHRVNAKKVWKALHTSDTKVFNSRERTETGNFVIDLLIDGSGSQYYRARSVRKQAFILAEALKQSGIPHKISFFHSYTEIQLLHILRHYDTTEFDTTDVFSYEARWDNRDGYFLKAVTHDIEHRPEEHKVIIVLSDGQPQSSNSWEWKELYATPDFWYEDEVAVADTRAQINAARDKNIAVMGMYVGDSPDTLKAEKAMYGSDFVYLGEKVDNFSSIAIKSLAKHIQTIMSE